MNTSITMSTSMLIMGTPTSIPTTTSSTVMTTTILMGVNTIMSIITATNTTLSHIIRVTSTKNITGITSMSTPASSRRFVSIRSKQLIIPDGGVSICGYAPVLYTPALSLR